jgi:hypothetical protein
MTNDELKIIKKPANLIMIMMIVRNNFVSGLDDLGSLADVGEVLPRRDLRVGDAVVRHQRGPGVKSDLKKQHV